VDGTDRRYLVTVPDEHDGETALPVVLDFHGLGEGAEIHAQMTQWSALAEEEGVVVVYPHGTGEPVQWNASPDPANPDLAYVDALVADVTGSLCVDEARVHATGLSNGAMMASLLACERSGVVAAVAPVAGLTDVDGCDPDRPVPVVTFHGTEDPILLFNGGVDLSGVPFGGGDGDDGAGTGETTTTRPPADRDGPGYPATVAAFAERNGCDPGPTDTDVSDEVVRRTYDCPDGADVEFYIIEGGGHSWPSSDFSTSIVDIVGYTTYDVDGTRDAWGFLRRFALS
jgi:polyhydroxybutyrate depolymerase